MHAMLNRGRFVGRGRGGGWLIAWCILVVCADNTAAQQTNPSGKQRREQLQSLLNGAVLEGFFTVDDEGDTEPALRKERYEIRSVKPLGSGDTWLFESRITYGEHDLTVPLPLPVRWAGDTPVICVDSVTIPALGTFSARVVIEGDRYAGTWQHDKVGGHLFGRILRPEGSP
jgi:hypothetical protein